MQLETHWHYMFNGFSARVGENQQGLLDVVVIEVVSADTEAEALAKAAEKVKCNGYTVVKVWECTHCPANALNQEIAVLNIKALSKIKGK